MKFALVTRKITLEMVLDRDSNLEKRHLGMFGVFPRASNRCIEVCTTQVAANEVVEAVNGVCFVSVLI